MQIKAPRGTQDVLPKDSYKWHLLEKRIRELCDLYQFREIRTPAFEHTDLFIRGVGETTDIVEKEMYTFLDKGNRSITLKPEGTASAVRSLIEHKLYADPMPLKMYYLSTPVFRYEKPQAGRLREHHQFGVECFGSIVPNLDAEIISIAMTLFQQLGLKNLSLNINSIGCPTCRPVYRQKLKEYFETHKEDLCETCLSRLERNPIRILDCKNESCREVVKNAPRTIDYLCEDCSDHFHSLQEYLTILGYDFVVNPGLVRGLDYYTKTVFEIISTDLGAQSTVCGGGRYDKLVEECGGPDLAGIGFGMGIERLLMILEKQGLLPEEPYKNKVYIASMDEASKKEGFRLLALLRKNGISAEGDLMSRSFKAQMKYADKINFTHTVIIGEEEVKTKKFTLKNMELGTQESLTEEELINTLK